MITRRHFLQATIGAAVSGLGIGLYTWQIEPHWVEVVSRQLPIQGLPTRLEGRTLIQLSDIHVGAKVSDGYVLDTFRRIKALAPDILVYTGDMIDYDNRIFSRAERVYAELPTGQLATVGILGNHDYGPQWSHPKVAARLADILKSAGVQILRNEVTEVAGLQIAGLDDLWAKQFDVVRGLAPLDCFKPAIALSHNPDTVDKHGWGGFHGWILSGHTHGGQCKPPFIDPPLLPVRNLRYTAGEFALSGERRLYINRGLGHLIQARFNVRPEVTLFTLVNA
jgi:uncharacterized protein